MPNQITEHCETSHVIDPQVPCRFGRVSHPLDQWYGLLMEEMQELFLYGDSDKLVDPTAYEDEICDIDTLKWKIAMDSEMEFMYFN